MLKRLKIRNFALVEDLDLTFERGMTVLTGETGAGKSVIVTALGLVLGDRADREHIRHGAAQAVVEAEFSVDHMNSAYHLANAEFIAGDVVAIQRTIAKDGASKAWANGVSTTVARLKELTSPLAEILGQHANQLLLDESNHLLFLDRFAGLDADRQAVSLLFHTWEQAYLELKHTRAKRDDLARERELLTFQQSEIDRARIRVGEEEELNNERRVLDSSRALMESAAQIVNLLDGEDGAVLDQLRVARKELDRMATIDTGLQAQAEQLADVDYQIEELRRFIEQYGSSVPDNPQRLEEINLRLDEIYSLKQKYGGSEATILDHLKQIESKLQDRPDVDAQLSHLEAEAERCKTAYADKAKALSEIRTKAARYLEKLTIKELADLAIDRAQFECRLEHEDHASGVELHGRLVRPYAHGLENARFLFSANPGEPAKSLARTASGGEISRVLLSLKAAEKKNNNLLHSLMVFDEVDAGIGGRTGTKLAEKLHRLAEGSQVLVITHLHQIARVANHHFLAEKTGGGKAKRVTINVTRLDAAGIVRELERMVALPET
jgi:DNA repair protein RecN (Recombination protein N)